MDMTAPLGSRQEKIAFYKHTFQIAFPITLQNLMDAAVSAADVLMLSFVGQNELAASSLANQISFILHMLLYGVGSGACVLVAQHWGNGDKHTIEKTLGLALKIAVGVSAIFALGALLAPEWLMSLYTNDADLILPGAKYLRAVAASYVLGAFCTVYLNVMRSVERTRFSAIVHCSAVITNVVLNACFIFGWPPFPKLGIVGVALATSITRLGEFGVCLIDQSLKPAIRLRVLNIIRTERELLSRFMRYTLPAAANDIIWGLGFSMYAVILGHLSKDIVAANSVASVVRSLGTVLCFGMASSASIILGKAMGEGRLAEARAWAGRFAYLSVWTALAGGAVILLGRPFVLSYMHLYVEVTDVVKTELNQMLLINSYYVLGQSINTMLICGIFRAGGDVKFGLMCDSFAMWVYAVPVGLLCAFVFNLHEMQVYFILCLDEFVKMPFIFLHYRKRGWLCNITKTVDENILD